MTPVVDAALEIDVADPNRIAYHAWSLGGYFAPRVAAYEHRLAAIVVYPGQLDVGVKFFDLMNSFGLGADAVAKLPVIDPEDEKTVLAAERETARCGGKSCSVGSGPTARPIWRPISRRWPSGGSNPMRSRRSDARRSSLRPGVRSGIVERQGPL